MAENAFTVLKNYVPEFFDAMLIASRDPKLVMRVFTVPYTAGSSIQTCHHFFF
jgi:hypothetical protein